MEGYLSRKKKILKIKRFFSIYGFERTYVKIMGRVRKKSVFLKLPISFFPKEKNIAIIGAGQFGFATIGYFIKKKFGNVFYGVYDLNSDNAKSFVNYYRGKQFDNPSNLINDDKIKYVYIASNHATHTDYAIKALKEKKIVYLEKPISVNKEQFSALQKELSNGGELYVGYNRPFSPAVQEIRKRMKLQSERNALTLNCFITGHKIPKDHWYRNPEEGTRVCGNIGHWLDLTINLLNTIGLPNSMLVKIHSSSEEEKDDNLVITMTTDQHDLVSIMLSSREEPFEGINESINIQYSHLIAKIDDFRRLKIWDQEKLIKKRYFRKDVGHKNAIYQPFKGGMQRDFNEVLISTRLMLDITEAIINNKKEFIFSI